MIFFARLPTDFLKEEPHPAHIFLMNLILFFTFLPDGFRSFNRENLVHKAIKYRKQKNDFSDTLSLKNDIPILTVFAFAFAFEIALENNHLASLVINCIDLTLFYYYLSFSHLTYRSTITSPHFSVFLPLPPL